MAKREYLLAENNAASDNCGKKSLIYNFLRENAVLLDRSDQKEQNTNTYKVLEYAKPYPLVL